MAMLSPRERFVLAQRDAQVFRRVIAEALGVSSSRVQTIEWKARRKQQLSEAPHDSIAARFESYPKLYNAIWRHYGCDSIKLGADLRAGAIHPGSLPNVGLHYCSLLYELFGVTEPEHPPYVRRLRPIASP